jgi:predicted nuclease with RNAse H fold
LATTNSSEKANSATERERGRAAYDPIVTRPDRRTGRRYVAAGIDVAEEGKGLDVVALDQARRLLASRGRMTVAEAVEFVVNDVRPDIVCIDSPSGWSRTGRSREAERGLARMGISSYPTGPDPGDHHFYRWMRVGMALFDRLERSYPVYQGGDLRGSAVEVFPNASALLLAGRRRRPGETKNGFRRAVLAQHGVEQADLPNLDRVDAGLAALTGLVALAGVWAVVGEPTEGLVLLPVSELPGRPLPRG